MDILNPRAVGQITESLGTGFTGPHLQIHQVKLIAEIGVSMVQILAYARQSLVEGETSLDANPR